MWKIHEVSHQPKNQIKTKFNYKDLQRYKQSAVSHSFQRSGWGVIWLRPSSSVSDSKPAAKFDRFEWTNDGNSEQICTKWFLEKLSATSVTSAKTLNIESGAITCCLGSEKYCDSFAKLQDCHGFSSSAENCASLNLVPTIAKGIAMISILAILVSPRTFPPWTLAFIIWRVVFPFTVRLPCLRWIWLLLVLFPYSSRLVETHWRYLPTPFTPFTHSSLSLSMSP